MPEHQMPEHSAVCSRIYQRARSTHCRTPPESTGPLGKHRSAHELLPDWHWLEESELRQEEMHTAMYPEHMQNDSLMGLVLLLHMALPFTKVEESKKKTSKVQVMKNC